MRGGLVCHAAMIFTPLAPLISPGTHKPALRGKPGSARQAVRARRLAVHYRQVPFAAVVIIHKYPAAIVLEQAGKARFGRH